MQFTFNALVKLAVFSVVANTVAAVSLPEPVGLEARQTNSQCLLNLCNPGAATAGCCGAAGRDHQRYRYHTHCGTRYESAKA